MPTPFAGYEVVKATPNFLITCEDDAGARQRAHDIAAVAETDLARLNQLFSTHFEYGTSSPWGIWVVVLKDDPTSDWNGQNHGYETLESSQIWIRTAFTPPTPPPPSIFPPDPPPLPGPNLNTAVMEFPRFVFVAELAEILMQFTGYGWDPGHSPGEGLSNVLGALLHPAGYYDTGQGPRINSWLNGQSSPAVIPPYKEPRVIPPRKDFVTNAVDTDRDIFSYGCAILFINYLVHQLGHPLEDVIRAGGASLAETYARVTGRPQAAAYTALNSLLEQHINGSVTNAIQRDDIFPLLDVTRRSIQTTVADPIDSGHHTTDTTPVSWKVDPGPFCPAAPYDFLRHRGLVEQPVFAHARGMADAAFRWSAAGVDLTVHESWANVTLPAPLTVHNPDGTTTAVSTSVNLNYGIVDRWNSSVLYLETLNSDGNCEFTVGVTAKEKNVTGDAEVTAETTATLTTVTWTASDELIKARKTCNPFYARLNETIWYLTQQLSNLKNRPDPPSELGLRDVVQAVEHLQDAVRLFADAGSMTEAQVWAQVFLPGILRSTDPVPPPVHLTDRQLNSKRPASPLPHQPISGA